MFGWLSIADYEITPSLSLSLLEFGRCTHRTSATSEQAGTSANWHQQIAHTNVFKKSYHVFFLLNYNVVFRKYTRVNTIDIHVKQT